MQDLYLISDIEAGRLYSMPYYMMIVLGPVFGFINSKFNKKIPLCKHKLPLKFLVFIAIAFHIASILVIMFMPTCD